MKKNILLLWMSFFFIACGAQSKSSDTIETSPITRVPSVIELPKTSSIDFPFALTSMHNNEFNSDLESIGKIVLKKKEVVELLIQVMDKVVNKCKEQDHCFIEANYFTVKVNNQDILLDEIHFNKFDLSENHQYEFRLKLAKKETLSFKWSEKSTDVISIYEKDTKKLKMHYFRDTLEEKEVLFITKLTSNSVNSLMMKFDNKKNSYRIYANYMSEKNHFYANIFLKDEIILEENENIFELVDDFSTLEEGSYVLKETGVGVEKLNLLELFEQSSGSVLSFNHKVQGFMYSYVNNTDLVREVVIPVRITTFN